jgi:hypothetical protein
MSQPSVGGQSSGRTGQMTAVMRAIQTQNGPKVLRIGIVAKGGRVIEERIIKQRGPVTIGTSEKATFTIGSDLLPERFTLFELSGNDYALNFIDGMSGRLALPTGISELSALRGTAKKSGNVYQVRLGEDTRGRVVVGETTILFQFVTPPPPQPKPQIPLSIQGGIANTIDWNLAIIAAFSFLLHFGFIGAMYTDWFDPVHDEDEAFAGLLEAVKNIPQPQVEAKVEEKTDAEKDKKQEKKAPEQPSKSAAPSSAPPKTPGGGAKSKVSDAKAAALSAQADALMTATLAALGGTGPTVAGALKAGEVPGGDVSKLAASSAGAQAGAGGDLKLGTGGGGPVRPGGGGGGLAGIGGGTGGSGTGGSAGAVAVAGPKGDIQIGKATSTVQIDNLEATVNKLKPGYRQCYNKGLEQDPSMAGRAVFVANVGPNGEVTSVDVRENSGLSDFVLDCIKKKIRNAEFAPPGGGGAPVQLPVNFIKQ